MASEWTPGDEAEKKQEGALLPQETPDVPDVWVDVDHEEGEIEDPQRWWKAFRTGKSLDRQVADRELRPREAAFVVEYLRDGGSDATNAAIRAGYAQKGAHVQALRMLNRPKVRDAIAREMARKIAAAQVSSDWVVTQLQNIAEDQEVKTNDKLRALELLGRNLGMFQPEQLHIHHHQGVKWADIAQDSTQSDAIDADFEPVSD